MKKKRLKFWACDFSNKTGEGKLAKIFILYLKQKKNYQTSIMKNNKIKLLNYKYISPFVGIFNCWKYYLKKERIAYINYLPLWNPFIFMLLPPKTIIGPITGGSLFNKKNLFNYLLRKYIFKIFYKISEFFLNLREVDILFSTELLKKKLSNRTLKKSKFNFVLNSFNVKKKIKKKLDFLIYYRRHGNKENFFPFTLIKQLASLGFKISIIGDRLNLPLIKNYGIISNSLVLKLQSIARYTIASGENPYSFFNLECISNNVKIVIDKKDIKLIKFYNKCFIGFDFNKDINKKTIYKKFIK